MARSELVAGFSSWPWILLKTVGSSISRREGTMISAWTLQPDKCQKVRTALRRGSCAVAWTAPELVHQRRENMPDNPIDMRAPPGNAGLQCAQARTKFFHWPGLPYQSGTSIQHTRPAKCPL